MYPCNAVLVGNFSTHGADLRNQLRARHVRIEAEFPTADAALAQLPTFHETARLIFCAVENPEELQALKLLHRGTLKYPLVAVLPANANRAAILVAQRAGAEQILLTPSAESDLDEVLEEYRLRFSDRHPASELVVVAGTAGGCGASSVALNLGWELAGRQQRSCVVLDLSLQLGSLAGYANVEPRYTTDDMLSREADLPAEMFEQALVRLAPNLQLLAGPTRIAHGPVPTVADVSRLIDRAREVAEVVIVDLPNRFDKLYFDVLAMADRVILVAPQTVPGLQGLKRIREELAAARSGGALNLVVNHYDAHCRSLQLSELRRLFPNDTLFALSQDCATAREAVNFGQSWQQLAPRSPLTRDLREMAGRLFGAQLPPAPSESGLFRLTARLLGLKEAAQAAGAYK